MDSTLEHYIHLGVSLVVATAVLVMVASLFSLRRDAQVAMANRNFYEEQYKYKSKFEGLSGEEVTTIEIIGLITQYADELDIYVDRLSKDSYGSLSVNSTDRYNIETLDLTDEQLNAQFTWVTKDAKAKEAAKKYGIASAATLGKVIYGTDTWKVTVIYDNANPMLPANPDNYTVNPKITGLRIIKN